MPERTEAEREAARMERERRRIGRAGGSWAPGAAAGQAGAAEDQVGAAHDRDGAAEDQVGTADDRDGAAEDQVGAADDRDGAADDRDGAADDRDGAIDSPPHIPEDTLPPVSPRRASPPTRRRRPPVRARNTSASRSGSHLHRALVVVALVVVAVIVWLLVELFQPFHGDGHGSVVVRVPRGANIGQIGDLLANRGVVSSSFFFGLRAKLSGDGGSIEAGSYRFPLDTSYGNALRILTTPPPAPKTTYVTIIEGLARRQVDALLRSQHVRGSYLATTRHSKLLDPASYGAPASVRSLEGFLFPDTYQAFSPLRIHQLVDDQLTTFKHQFASVNLRYARAHNLTPYDVLTIASLVQGEAATRHDMELVAAVIYNRLRLGMELGLDSTTRYATGNYSTPLTVSQLDSPSPWNTRNHVGLPPTPINSPGLTAIDAAAHPASSNALYFVVKPCGNGEMTFTASYQQFLADSAAYQAARARHGGNSPEFCKKKG